MKLMIKVLAVFIAAIAIMAYFMQPSLLSTSPTTTTETSKKGLQKMAALPSEISESSGIIALDKGQYVTHNDAGNKPHLYIINHKAKIKKTIEFELPNVDWEDLASDKEGNIYIADTGNNNNKRRELAIYKVSLNSNAKPQAIRFTYEDQKEYPPSKKDHNFDCEAIFWYNGHVYLVSKDRGRSTTAKVYRVPDEPGNYEAKLLGSHKIKAMITGATISPDEKTVALISEGKLHLFTAYTTPASFYEGKYEEINLKKAGQTEAVAFEDNETIIITSEGGNMYSYTL